MLAVAKLLAALALPHQRQRRAIASAAITLLMLCGTATAAMNAGAMCERGWQPIILNGSQLPALLGKAESHFEVLADHGGELAPIPFQVNERLPDGRFAMAYGIDPLEDDSPGILDKNDQVLMMFSDMGERLGDLHRRAPGTLEIAVYDPLSRVRRYAYIAAVTAPRRSPVRYITYRRARDLIETDSYTMGFRNDFPSELAFGDREANGRTSLISGAGVKASATVLMWFKFHLTRKDIHNHLRAWTIGPISLIRRQRHSVNLVLGIKSPAVESDEFFYRDYGDDPFIAHVPWVPRAFFGDVEVRTWLDFIGIGGFEFSWNGITGGPLRIGDRTAEAAVQAAPPPTDWTDLAGDGHMLLQTFRPTPELKTINPQLYYRASPACTDASDDSRARWKLGYLMTGWENLSAGTHRLDTLLMMLPQRCRAAQILNQLATPLVVRVRAAASN